MKKIILLLLFFTGACHPDHYYFDKILLDCQNMKNISSSKEIGEIDLNKYFNFHWDSIYYFPNPSSYIIKERVLKRFNYSYKSNFFRSEMSELYFLRQGRLVTIKSFNPKAMPLNFFSCSANEHFDVFYQNESICTVKISKGTLLDFYDVTEKKCYETRASKPLK